MTAKRNPQKMKICLFTMSNDLKGNEFKLFDMKLFSFLSYTLPHSFLNCTPDLQLVQIGIALL